MAWHFVQSIIIFWGVWFCENNERLLLPSCKDVGSEKIAVGNCQQQVLLRESCASNFMVFQMTSALVIILIFAAVFTVNTKARRREVVVAFSIALESTTTAAVVVTFTS